jgi:hypothetical protein
MIKCYYCNKKQSGKEFESKDSQMCLTCHGIINRYIFQFEMQMKLEKMMNCHD